LNEEQQQWSGMSQVQTVSLRRNMLYIKYIHELKFEKNKIVFKNIFKVKINYNYIAFKNIVSYVISTKLLVGTLHFYSH
jgi:competence transcription factor ComK